MNIMNKSASTTPKTVSFPWIVENYDVILFDAYGVLVNGSGAIDGAVGALDLLKKQKKNYLILTNGATRTIPIMAKRYQQKGLDIPENKIFSSGSRLFHAFRNLGLIQPKCLVLGPESSHDLVRENGGKVLSLDSIESNYNEVDALVDDVDGEAAFTKQPSQRCRCAPAIAIQHDAIDRVLLTLSPGDRFDARDGLNEGEATLIPLGFEGRPRVWVHRGIGGQLRQRLW